jgi:hypothetical protein
VSTYELDDDLVRSVTGADPDASPGDRDKALSVIKARLRYQLPIPIPVPTKVGAVVRTDIGYFFRWAYEHSHFSPWIEFLHPETPLRTDQIGRITEVPFEGVDL